MLGDRHDRVHPVLYLLLGALGVLVFFMVAPLWAAIFGGLLVAYLGYPLHRRMLERVGNPAGAAGLSLLSVSVIVLIPLGLVGYLLVLEAQHVFRSLTTARLEAWFDSVAGLTRSWFGWPTVDPDTTAGAALLEEVVPRVRATLLSWLPDAAQFLFEFTIIVTVVLFIAYYAFKDGPRMIAFVRELLPFREETEERIIQDVGRYLDAVVFGQLMTALVQGSLAGVGFWMFGVPSPVFLGFLSALLSILPGIGPFLVWLPAGVYLWAIGAPVRAVGMFVWGGLIVSTSDHVIRSKVMSVRGGMHPVIALLGVIGGLIAFGVVGFIVGPVVLALFVSFLGIYVEQRPSLEEETQDVARILAHAMHEVEEERVAKDVPEGAGEVEGSG